MTGKLGRENDNVCSICFDEMSTEGEGVGEDFTISQGDYAGVDGSHAMKPSAPTTVWECYHTYHVSCLLQYTSARKAQKLDFKPCPCR